VVVDHHHHHGGHRPATLTVKGRVIAVLLMLGGITLIGIVTATMASWIVQRVAAEDTEHQAATDAEIDNERSRTADYVAAPRDSTDERPTRGRTRRAMSSHRSKYRGATPGDVRCLD
jgi:hypothetical protein